MNDLGSRQRTLKNYIDNHERITNDYMEKVKERIKTCLADISQSEHLKAKNDEYGLRPSTVFECLVAALLKATHVGGSGDGGIDGKGETFIIQCKAGRSQVKNAASNYRDTIAAGIIHGVSCAYLVGTWKLDEFPSQNAVLTKLRNNHAGYEPISNFEVIVMGIEGVTRDIEQLDDYKESLEFLYRFLSSLDHFDQKEELLEAMKMLIDFDYTVMEEGYAKVLTAINTSDQQWEQDKQDDPSQAELEAYYPSDSEDESADTSDSVDESDEIAE